MGWKKEQTQDRDARVDCKCREEDWGREPSSASSSPEGSRFSKQTLPTPGKQTLLAPNRHCLLPTDTACSQQTLPAPNRQTLPAPNRQMLPAPLVSPPRCQDPRISPALLFTAQNYLTVICLQMTPDLCTPPLHCRILLPLQSLSEWTA